MTIGTMSDSSECALPKSESSWLEGVHLKNEHDNDLKRDLERFRREVAKTPDPNFGRIGELKEKIRKKTLITKEAIEEAAEKIAAIFFGKPKP